MKDISKFSVIIRVKNEEAFIGSCIQSCLDLLNEPEIIIVDNNSTDRSMYVANLFKHDTDLPSNSQSYTDVRCCKIVDYSPGKALNLGARQASREYILILSSHCTMRRFEEAKAISELQTHKALFGNQIPNYFGKVLKKRYLWSHFTDHDEVNMYSEMEERHFFHNAFAATTREFLLQNPFDENLVGKEDRYWASQIVNSGETYLYKSDFECSHFYTSEGNTWKGVG